MLFVGLMTRTHSTRPTSSLKYIILTSQVSNYQLRELQQLTDPASGQPGLPQTIDSDHPEFYFPRSSPIILYYSVELLNTTVDALETSETFTIPITY